MGTLNMCLQSGAEVTRGDTLGCPNRGVLVQLNSVDAAGALAQIDQAVKVLLRRGVEDVEPEEYVHPRLLVRVRRRRPRHRMSENESGGGAYAVATLRPRSAVSPGVAPP